MPEPAVLSLLDTDLYKYTMAQLVFHQFSDTQVKYKFLCRSSQVDLRPLKTEIESQLKALESLFLEADDIDFLRSLKYFKPDFMEFMKDFRFNTSFVRCRDDGANLEIEVQGPWLQTIFFEVPILAIVSQTYVSNNAGSDNFTIGRDRISEKIQSVRDYNSNKVQMRFADFGTRRRASSCWHREVLSLLSGLPGFIGTSNVHFAKEFNLQPVGTMAHEYLQACQSLAPDLRSSQMFALERWLKEYPDVLGIALSDIFGMDAFLRDFGREFATAFEGCRQDSGDPYVWADKLLRHYDQLNIDSRGKKAIFSDGLNIQEAMEIQKKFGDKLDVSFGIGTNLTNDCELDPISIVLKMVECQGKPVAKISDSKGKQMCEDLEHIETLKSLFGISDI